MNMTMTMTMTITTWKMMNGSTFFMFICLFFCLLYIFSLINISAKKSHSIPQNIFFFFFVVSSTSRLKELDSCRGTCGVLIRCCARCCVVLSCVGCGLSTAVSSCVPVLSTYSLTVSSVVSSAHELFFSFLYHKLLAPVGFLSWRHRWTCLLPVIWCGFQIYLFTFSRIC